MAERDVRIKATTEGTDQAARDFERIADAEKEVTGASADAGKSTEELKVNQEKLSQVINQINPALGSWVDAAFDAIEAFGKLGTVNLANVDIIAKARQAVLKYKDSLLLLGAGGAAVGAIFFLISVWKKLQEEMREAINLAERFQETQRSLESKREDVRKQVIEGFAKTKPTATEDEVRKAIDRAENLRENLGVDPGRAAAIATGQAPPLTAAERGFRLTHATLTGV